MRRVPRALLLAIVAVSAGCAGQQPAGELQAEGSPATAREDLKSFTAPVCAPSPDPCEDVLLWDSDGVCTTNLERDCIEAEADQALRQWVADPQRGPRGGGDVRLLEVLDEQTIVVGYAFGSDLTFVGVEVEDAGDGSAARS